MKNDIIMSTLPISCRTGLGGPCKGGAMEDKKVKLLVYATESERTRIKLAATRLGMSMTQFMLDSIMEQVSSVEDLEKKGETL